MDGYAVRAQDTFGASLDEPVRLRLVGRAMAGGGEPPDVGPGECVEVSTGSMLLRGADAVVRLEGTLRSSEEILVFEPVVPGQNVMEADADIRKGQKALLAGEILTPSRLGVLSALGLRRVRVFVKPKVAVISTGVELVEPGHPLEEGKIYDINWISLAKAVEAVGGEAFFLGVARDELEEIKSFLSRGLEIADVVVASGASSVGTSDIMKDALEALGADIIVDGVRCKPGKPTIIALAGEKPIFCLPGNPASALITFMVFVEPILARMAGLKGVWRPTARATLALRVVPDVGRHNFIPVSLSRRGDGALVATPILKGSGAITSLAMAQGYVEAPEGTEFLPEGEEVLVKLFWPVVPLGRSDLEPPSG